MRATNYVFLVLLTLLFMSGSALAEQKKGDQSGEIKAELQVAVTENGPVHVGNKICPVSQEKVGEMGDPVEFAYEGKNYKFCCAMCIIDFKKDPQKYIKQLENLTAEENMEDGS